MDTRNKILSGESALETACRLKREGRRLKVVTGYFDVLQAAHIRDLLAVRNGDCTAILMVVLLPHAGSLLSQRARAELVAGIGVVDYVVTDTDSATEDLLSRVPADEVISRQSADEEQARLLIQHVYARHSV